MIVILECLPSLFMMFSVIIMFLACSFSRRPTTIFLTYLTVGSLPSLARVVPVRYGAPQVSRSNVLLILNLQGLQGSPSSCLALLCFFSFFCIDKEDFCLSFAYPHGLPNESDSWINCSTTSIVLTATEFERQEPSLQYSSTICLSNSRRRTTQNASHHWDLWVSIYLLHIHSIFLKAQTTCFTYL